MLKNPNYIYGGRNLGIPMHLNFGRYILDRLKMFEHQIAVINGATHESTTYGTYLQHSMSFALSLTQMGLKKGDVIGLLSENRNEFWGAVFGITCTGAVLTTLSTSYEEDELKHALNISKPKYIICSPDMYKKHYQILRNQSFIKETILFGENRINNSLLYNDMIKIVVNFEDFEAVDVDGQNDVLFILYSSGTTGLAKGVMLTHYNVLCTCVLPVSLDPSVKSFSVSPWYHVMGLVGCITGLVMGRTGVYLTKFDLDTYLSTIQHYKITQLTVVPPILVAVNKLASKYDLTSVKYIYSGAAPLHKDTIISAKKTFPNLEAVLQGYGASETTLAIVRFPFENRMAAKDKPGSVGRAVEGCVLKIVDIETRQPLGPRQPGEICVKGPCTMKGYVGLDNSDYFDEEGFYKTGDVGYYDEDRYIYIEDRLKELIKYKGFQVPPAELEALLLTHPSVKDAGVIGIPDPEAGEVPLAFVVAQPGVKCSEQELKKFVAMKLSNPKHLRGGVQFVDQIPKSPSGKILRRELRMMAKGRSKL